MDLGHRVGRKAFQVGGRRAGEEVPRFPGAERRKRCEVDPESRGAGPGGVCVSGPGSFNVLFFHASRVRWPPRIKTTLPSIPFSEV